MVSKQTSNTKLGSLKLLKFLKTIVCTLQFIRKKDQKIKNFFFYRTTELEQKLEIQLLYKTLSTTPFSDLRSMPPHHAPTILNQQKKIKIQ